MLGSFRSFRRESIQAEVINDLEDNDWFSRSLQETFTTPVLASVEAVEEDFAPQLKWIVDSGASFDVIDRSLVDHMKEKWRRINTFKVSTAGGGLYNANTRCPR